TVEGDIRAIWLLLLAAPLGTLLIIFPKMAVVVLAIQVFLVRTLYDYHVLPREATWLTDVLIAIVVGRMLLLLPWRKDRVRKLEWFIASLVAFAVLSTLINGNSPVTFAAGMRMGFRYLFLFLAAAYLDVSPTWIRRYIYFLIGIALLQMPISIIQFSMFRWKDPDLITGTFGRGQTGLLAIFLLSIMAYFIAQMIERGRIPLRYLILIAIISVPPVLGSGKFFFVFLPVLILFMVRTEFFRRPLTAVLIAMTSISLFVGADYLIAVTGGSQSKEKTPLEFLGKLPDVFEHEIRVAKYGRFGRTDRYIAAVQQTSRSAKNILIGEGPGSITGLAVAEHHSRKAAYYGRWGLTSISAMSAPWLLVEYGFVGLVFLFSLLWLIFRRARFLRAADDPQTHVFGRMLEGITLVYFVGTLYSSVWQMDSASMMFWPLAGMLVRLSYAEQTRQQQTAIEPASEPVTLPLPSLTRA
ncbi:MAG: hypothetical protein PHI18_04440, partial [bacterium]|nr:hypothetical protein [bacterium]